MFKQAFEETYPLLQVSPSQGSNSTPEVDYLWNVLLNNLNADVAAGAQEMVGNLYAQTFESQHEFIRFVITCLSQVWWLSIILQGQHCQKIDQLLPTFIYQNMSLQSLPAQNQR